MLEKDPASLKLQRDKRLMLEKDTSWFQGDDSCRKWTHHVNDRQVVETGYQFEESFGEYRGRMPLPQISLEWRSKSLH